MGEILKFNITFYLKPITLSTYIEIYQKIYNDSFNVEGDHLYNKFYEKSFPNLIYKNQIKSGDLF